MGPQTLQDRIYNWASQASFTAPYGVLTGQRTSKKGSKYWTVTFGRARTLDVTVMIFNEKFVIVKTSRHGSQTFTNTNDLFLFLNSL